MGQTRQGFRRTNTRVILLFSAITIAGFLLSLWLGYPATIPFVALPGFVVLVAVFLRFLW